MATKPDRYAEQYVAHDAEFTASHRAPQPMPRVLFTHLTNGQLADCGLVVERARKDSVRQEMVSGGVVVPLVPVTRWLVQETLDRHDHDLQPSWWPSLVARVDDLRAIAAEEGLSFSEPSAIAALGFARRHGRSRQPSAFLIGNGNIRLLWLEEGQEQIGLQFRGLQDVQIVLFERSCDRLDPITTHKRADDVMLFLERNRLARLL